MILKRVTEKHVNNEVEKNKNTQAIPGANHTDSDMILFQPRLDDVLDGYHTRQRQRRPRLLPFARTMIQKFHTRRALPHRPRPRLVITVNGGLRKTFSR